jgi:hypothetical protein
MGKSLKDSEKQVVLLIHGIRTRAWWQGPVKALIEEDSGATVIPLKYDYFDLLRFWCPFGICRQGPIGRLHKDLRNTINQFKGWHISAIAHSYGTFALSRILIEHDDIELDRIILCGSIIPNAFPWSRIQNQIKGKPMREAVLNECGTKDIWPVLAASTTWGYGNSGTYGFGSVQVTDRIHEMPHSGYFEKDFVKKFWAPFLASGKIISSGVEKAGTGTPSWFSVLSLPWKWFATAAVVLIIGSGSWRFVLPDEAKQWACNNVIAIGGIAAGGDINAGDITINGQSDTSGKASAQCNYGSENVISEGGVAAGGHIEAKDIKIGNGQ